MATATNTWRDKLLADLTRRYEERFPRSGLADARARNAMIDGGNHPQRLFEPYPFRITAAHGARVVDLDAHDILDYWQGHYANILGHNPPELCGPLARAFGEGWGLHTGIPDEVTIDLAEVLLRCTGDERVRFTTAGSLATMYALMLARAYTGRELVLKAAGGWHGAQPLALRGTHYGKEGFQGVDSQGVPAASSEESLVVRYNDLDELQAAFKQYGDRLAAFIVEPMIGTGGFIAANPEYLKAARELTHKHGALLVLDEIITGFRFHAGGLQQLYGVHGDLSTYGKIIGGGMPVSAVSGRLDVMDLASKSSAKRVLFNGGTFSAHPASMLAGKLLLEYLEKNAATVYPRLGEMGERLRLGIEKAFAKHDIEARCTGYGNEVIPGSSLIQVHFPHCGDRTLDCPELLWDPRNCDPILRERILKLGLALRDVHVMHGLGAVSLAHTEADLRQTVEACEGVAEEMARARRGA